MVNIRPVSMAAVQTNISTPNKNSDDGTGKGLKTKENTTKVDYAKSDIVAKEKPMSGDGKSPVTSESNEGNLINQDIKKGGAHKVPVGAQAEAAGSTMRTLNSDEAKPTDKNQKSQGNDDQHGKGDSDGSGGGSGYKRSRGLDYLEHAKKASVRGRRVSNVIQGSSIAHNSSQDVFIPAGMTVAKQLREKNNIETVKGYQLGEVGNQVYETVMVNTDPNADKGIGSGMQRELLKDFVWAMSAKPPVTSTKYRKIVREIVQGSIKSALESKLRLQEIVKMIMTGIMAVTPHDGNPDMMAKALEIISAEIIYGKANLGYSMKIASYSLGSGLFMLSVYYKNYQNKVEYTKDLDQKLKLAANQGIWIASGDITQYSEAHARSNTEKFVQGRIDEEQNFQANLVKGMAMKPIKKMESLPVVGGMVSKLRKKF